MRKLIIATITLLIGIFVIWLGYLWMTCPTEENIDERLLLGREVVGWEKAQKSESYMALYNMGAHLLDPLFEYRRCGLFVLVVNEGRPIAVFWGVAGFYEF